MSRSRKQQETFEELKRVNKELEAKVKRLERELRELRREKQEKKIEVKKQEKKELKIKEDKIKEITPLSDIFRCPSCMGKLNSIDMGSRTLIKCANVPNCNYVTSRKN